MLLNLISTKGKMSKGITPDIVTKQMKGFFHFANVKLKDTKC